MLYSCRNAIAPIIQVCLLLIAIFSWRILLAQPIASDSLGHIKFYFNKMPDTLRLNGKVIEVVNSEKVAVRAPGNYIVEAKLRSYSTIVKNLKMKPGQTLDVYIIFFKLTGHGTFLYKYGNFLSLPLAGYFSGRTSEQAKFVLPTVAIGATEHLISLYLRRKRFRPGGSYFHLPAHDGTITLYFGFPSSILYKTRSKELEVEVDYITRINRYSQKIDYYMLGNNMTNQYGIQVGVEKRLFKRISVSGMLELFPLAKSKILSEVHYSENGQPRTEHYESQGSSAFYMFQTGINFLLFPLYDQKFYIHAGRFWGKTMEAKGGPQIIERKRTWTPVNYDTLLVSSAKMKTGGWDLGGSIHSPITQKFYFYFSFDYLLNMSPDLKPSSLDQKLFVFTAGITYKF